MSIDTGLQTLRTMERVLGDDFIDTAEKLSAGTTAMHSIVLMAQDLATARFSVGDHSSHVAASDNCTLVVSAESSGDLLADFDGVSHEVQIRSGTLTFVPNGVVQEYDFRGSLTNTVISLNKRVFDRVVDMDAGFGSVSVLEPRTGWHRPALQKLIEEQYQTMAWGELGWKVFAEANALKLAAELLRTFGNARKPAKPTAMLSQAEVARLVEYIDAEIDQNFSLSELSALLDRDPFAFSRQFKAATGETPHQFVLQRRIMRAQQYLARSPDNLADIAYACGFSSQAHMTSTFTKNLGIAPGAYRKEMRK